MKNFAECDKKDELMAVSGWPWQFLADHWPGLSTGRPWAFPGRHGAKNAPYSPASPHRRNDKLSAFLGSRGPTRRYGFGLRVEPDRVRAVLVEVTEARALPPAESIVRQRHRNGEIHPHHADVDALGEISRGVAVAGEDGDAIAVGVLGWQSHRLLVVLSPHHAEHRAENLFFVDAHVRRHLVEQAAAHEVAVLIALQLESAAIDDELGAFLHAHVDITFDLVEMGARDQWPEVGMRVG